MAEMTEADDEEIIELATEVRNKFLGAFDEVGEGTVWNHYGDALAHINAIAEGERSIDEIQLVAIENLIDGSRDLNVHAPPMYGAVAPLDQSKELRDLIVEAK